MFVSSHEQSQNQVNLPAEPALSPAPPALDGQKLAEPKESGGVQASQDHAALLTFINAGCEPDQTPLLSRPASYEQKMKEYKREVQRQFAECPVANPIAAVLIRAESILVRYSSRAQQLFAENSDGRREWALLAAGNQEAFQLAVREPMGLVKQGRIEDALACYGKALEAAPHRAGDSYQTLTTLCLTLLRWQRDVKMGDDSLDIEVEPYLEFQALSSGLYWDSIEPTTHPREGYYPLASYSGLIDPFEAEPQPLDLPALRAALKQTDLPLAAIARAALQRAIKASAPSRVAAAASQAANFDSGVMLLLSGRADEAIPLLKESIGFDSRKMFSVRETEPLIWALRDSGATGEAVEAYGKALQNPDIDERHYRDFLRLCGEEVMRSGTTRSPWAVALPHLQARYDFWSQVHGEDLGGDWMISYHLARACQETGQSEKARELFQATTRILKMQLALYKDCVWHREKTYQTRMKQALQEIGRISVGMEMQEGALAPS